MTTHYESLQSLVSRGVFDSEPIGDYVRDIAMREKVLPLDELVCVEDEDSAVFLENHPGIERTIIATTYYGLRRNWSSNGCLISGALRLIKGIGECIVFSPSDVYVAFIEDDSIKPVNEVGALAGVQDLVNAVTAALVQLAYMEREGMLRDVKRTD